jgi:DNA-binding transcriptional ArsR family regulator
VSELDVARVAGLFADRSRAAMVELLLDGRDHSVRALAQAAGVAPSTATGHLGRLEAGGVAVSRRDGRERLVRLAGPEAAAAYEALAELARERVPVNGLREWTRREQLRAARTCYDHLAGKLGVAIADAALAADAIGSDFSLGSSAASWFARLGVEVDSLPRGRRPLVRVCTDWTEQREHLAGMVGAAVCASMLSAGWVTRRPTSRALVVTPHGEANLRRLGIGFEPAVRPNGLLSTEAGAVQLDAEAFVRDGA